MHHTSWKRASVLALLSLAAVRATAQTPLGAAFTYQGELQDAGDTANGLHDLRFRLFDVPVGGAPVGPTVCADNTPVIDGQFTVALDFGGAQFVGQRRWLEIEVRADTGLNCANTGGFELLAPRQELTAAPNAVFSVSALEAGTAVTATNATRLNGQFASFYQDASNLTAGTIFDTRLSSNVALLNSPQTFSATKTFSMAPSFNAAGAPFAVNSSSLVTNLNADLLDGLNSSTFLQSIPVPLTLSGTSASHIIKGENASTVGGSSGIFGLTIASTGATYGVYGDTASTAGTGVYGSALASTGVTYGGHFRAFSTSGRGVFAENTGLGVLGHSTSDDGVAGRTFATGRSGVLGYTDIIGSNGGYFYSGATSGSGKGVVGYCNSDSGYGVYGIAPATTGSNYGVFGETASTTGTGIYGTAYATTGQTYGGHFRAFSNSGCGLFAENTGLGALIHSGNDDGLAGRTFATGKSGVLGYTDVIGSNGGYFYSGATSGSGKGVVGYCNSETGYGVYGIATATTMGSTYGVYGECASFFGAGVYGRTNSTTGYSYAGLFESSNPDTHGALVGVATTGSTPGVRGEARGPLGIGVQGFTTPASGVVHGVQGRTSSISGRGVYGLATAGSGTNYGVYGSTDIAASGYAVYASGDMGASGLKPFRIDHPDDPENKYLLHYATESPEVLNSYSGKVLLDVNGEAMVELPHYFARINRDPRYTLTAVGAAMPMLHVAEEIDEAVLTAGAVAEPGEVARICSFRIAGGVARAKVSWRVEAVRNDRWVQRRGAPVEIEKQDLERGTYQHPELYGQPPEKGMNYEPDSKHAVSVVSETDCPSEVAH